MEPTKPKLPSEAIALYNSLFTVRSVVATSWTASRDLP